MPGVRLCFADFRGAISGPGGKKTGRRPFVNSVIRIFGGSTDLEEGPSKRPWIWPKESPLSGPEHPWWGIPLWS